MNYNKNHYVILTVLCLLLSVIVPQSTTAQIQFKPTSRMFIDGASYFGQENTDLQSGVALTDFRMGLKGSYEKFLMRAELGYANHKINFKDVYIRYNMTSHSLIQFGHFIIPFGLNSAYGTSPKQLMLTPSADKAFHDGRRIGIIHKLWGPSYWLSYGLFTDKAAMSKPTNASGRQGFSVMERALYHPICEDGKILQVGLSYKFSTAESALMNDHRYFSYSAPFMTSVDRRSAVNAIVEQAKNESKFCYELTAVYQNYALEMQYYHSKVTRNEGLSNYKARGLFAIGRCTLIKPESYKYNAVMGGLQNLSAGQLELSLGYGYVDTNDKSANIYGGQLQDFDLGLTYYINKYIALRSDYSHLILKQTPDSPTIRTNVVQMRVQYLF